LQPVVDGVLLCAAKINPRFNAQTKYLLLNIEFSFIDFIFAGNLSVLAEGNFINKQYS